MISVFDLQITMADIVVASLFEFKLDVAKTEPTVSALVTRVMELPNIKAWIARRPDTPF